MFADIDAQAGPGTYRIALGHQGRTAMAEAARRVAEDTLHATADDTEAAWQSLDGTEHYLVRIWPTAVR